MTKPYKDFDELPHAKQIERWENVERVLKALTPHQRKKHWKMSQFGEKEPCGTVACAAGHCSLDPWFRRRGFKAIWWTTTSMNRYKMSVSIYAFFGFDGSQRIFMNATQRSVRTVIKEVRGYIEKLRNDESVLEAV